jgi:hypothetical protein
VATQDYQATWAAYQEAIARLYERPVATMVERGEGDIAHVADLDERARDVADRSEELGQAAAQGLGSADPDQRELAELKLLAAGATDLAVANDLVRLAEEEVPSEVVERSSTLPATVTELQDILATPLETGVRSLMRESLEAQRTVGPVDLKVAKQALKDAAKGAMTDIRDDAADAGQLTFVSLTAVPIPPIQEAAGITINALMATVGEKVSILLRRAARLVVQAIDKILKALGKEAQGEARRLAAGWIDDLLKGTLIETLLDRLYQTTRIQDDVNQQIDHASEALGADPYNTASTRVAELATKFRKQRRVITVLVRGLAFARTWILVIQPWGPLALTTAYVAAIGYVVYAGGDYVDWFRTGRSERLDFVPGVRTVIRQAVGATSSC